MKIPIRFFYDLGASTTLLLRSWRFYYDSCRFLPKFRIVAESPSSGMGVSRNVITMLLQWQGTLKEKKHTIMSGPHTVFSIIFRYMC